MCMSASKQPLFSCLKKFCVPMCSVRSAWTSYQGSMQAVLFDPLSLQVSKTKYQFFCKADENVRPVIGKSRVWTSMIKHDHGKCFDFALGMQPLVVLCSRLLTCWCNHSLMPLLLTCLLACSLVEWSVRVQCQGKMIKFLFLHSFVLI